MPRNFERRAEHYKEAVVEEIDRPKWHEAKKVRMYETWKDVTALYAGLEQRVSEILNELNVSRLFRGAYHSFARKVFKLMINGASRRDIDAVVRYWVDRGADRRVLNKILDEIFKYHGTLTRK